jgi:hypothetical protein
MRSENILCFMKKVENFQAPWMAPAAINLGLKNGA